MELSREGPSGFSGPRSQLIPTPSKVVPQKASHTSFWLLALTMWVLGTWHRLAEVLGPENKTAKMAF